jgi:hypothetical protein
MEIEVNIFKINIDFINISSYTLSRLVDLAAAAPGEDQFWREYHARSADVSTASTS